MSGIGARPFIMEIEKHIIKPYTMNGGGYRYIGQDKVPTICSMYHNVFSTFPEKPYVMEIEKEIEETGYVKVDRKLNKKQSQDKASTLTVGGHGAGNHSDMDLLCVAIRGRESSCLTPRRTEYGKQIRKQYEAGEISEQRKNIQRLEPRKDGKTNCLTTVNKDNMIMEMNAVSCAMRQRDGAKLELRSDSKANALLAANRTKSMVAERTDGSMRRINNNICSEDSKTHTFLASSFKGAAANGMTLVNRKFRIRRLTPKECARLQTIPDWYEWKGKFPDGKVKDTSDTQIYKMCGNGWCVEVIKHIFNYLPR